MYKFFFCVILSLSNSGVQAQLYSDSISINFFLIDECRISQNISGEINHVHQTFQEDIFYFQCYFPNSSSSEEKIASFMEEYKMTIPHLTDYDKSITKHYGASIAPEVVVFDEKKQQVLYRGRIDNSYDAVGSRRRVITSRDLSEAMKAIKNEEEILVKNTEAIGCFLNVQK